MIYINIYKQLLAYETVILLLMQLIIAALEFPKLKDLKKITNHLKKTKLLYYACLYHMGQIKSHDQAELVQQ